MNHGVFQTTCLVDGCGRRLASGQRAGKRRTCYDAHLARQHQTLRPKERSDLLDVMMRNEVQLA